MSSDSSLVTPNEEGVFGPPLSYGVLCSTPGQPRTRRDQRKRGKMKLDDAMGFSHAKDSDIDLPGARNLQRGS